MEFLSESTGILLACCFGFACFGYDGGLFSGILTNKLFLETFDYPNDTMQGQITGLYDLGCFFGAIFTFIVGDRFGRKTIITSGSFIHVVGGAIQAASYSVPQIIVGRIVAGFGNGFMTVAIPVWLSETVPAHKRGKMLTLLSALNVSGIVFVTFLNFGMRYIKSHFSWRFPVAFQCALAGGTMVLTPFFPESPRWLIYRGYNDRAKRSLGRLFGADPDSPEVESMFSEVFVHVEEEKKIASERSTKDLFGKDRLHNLRRILLGAGTQFIQQFSGVNVALYYLPVLFQNSLGLSETLSLILAACNSVNLLICLVIACLFLIENVGRRKLMIWGVIGQGTCYLLVAMGLVAGNQAGSIVSVAFLFGFYTCFGLTWDAIPWLYPPEINSQEYRNIGASVSTATNWICNYVVVVITPIGVANIQWRFYLIFAILNYSFIPLLYFFYEETRGLSLEEIDQIFLRKNPDNELPVFEDKKAEVEHIE
ncbi:hypothetical protein TRICI_004036 [Trichomonascus ciferrii]|uniref:Major facilitator superfamily (MFS) profile domain-containing protein n=1 Tax=Trichomonascus ciferrii TaxID=44093 RepID=A0A642V3F5_9ASCO|nr:hypothetical protein TRICI_004036 [Trichomonascus ciferrii]